MRTPIVLAALALLAPLAAGAAAQEAARPTLSFRGFISATAFVQDQSFGFGNGENAEWASSGTSTVDQWFLGGDVRNTRLTMDVAVPELGGGWTAGGMVEVDFFGGFDGAGPFNDEQPQPRLRLAYADLKKGRTTVRIGQFWSPLLGNVPASLSHIGFPLGYGSGGVVGWRFPGIGVYHTLTGADAPVRTQVTLAAFRGSWIGGNILENQSFGEASTIPQVEGRVDLSGKMGATGWSAYVVGHVDRKDLSGVGAVAEDDELTGTAVELGARVTPGPLTLQGNAYWGRSIGQQLGHIVQFGDISGWGAWGQAGYALTERWSVWAFYGMANPDDGEVVDAVLVAPTPAVNRREARLENRQFATMLRYTRGPYSLGLEWLRADTDWATRTGTFTGGVLASDVREDFDRTANQIALSVLLAF